MRGRRGRKTFPLPWLGVLLALVSCSRLPESRSALPEAADLRPSPKNPFHWESRGGKPVFLAGGSSRDDFFQHPDREAELRALAAAGGNYLRNVMGMREGPHGQALPFLRLPDGRYNLDRWNPLYSERLDALLAQAKALGIVVQIELWDRFDDSRAQWRANPFRPANNVNDSAAESGLAPRSPGHPSANAQSFFFTTPAQRDNRTVLPYQQALVRRILEGAGPYPKVLFSIDNEHAGDPAWPDDWADFLHAEARRRGLPPVQVTERWNEWDLRAAEHRPTIEQPDRFTFFEASQNHHQKGDAPWEGLQAVREALAERPRPINAVKIYGSAYNGHGGSAAEAITRYWRRVLGGAAAARFHRPPSGLGGSALARAQLRATRQLLTAYDLFRAGPDGDHRLLDARAPGEADLSHIAGQDRYTVLFPGGGEVRLAVAARDSRYQVRWLNPAEGGWTAEEILVGREGTLPLAAPAGPGLRLGVIARVDGRASRRTPPAGPALASTSGLAFPRDLRTLCPLQAVTPEPMVNSSTTQPLLEVRNLHKRYGELEVLRGIDVRAQRGDVVSIIGSSGSGKSTFLRCINLLEESEEGEILFEEEAVEWRWHGSHRQPSNHRQVVRIRTQLAMVFQQFNLWAHMTILQNVMEAPVVVLKEKREEVEERARALLAKVGIADKADAWPAQLSGGQQQRAAIARALCVQPKALLFDEPTSALDPELEQEVVAVIRDLAREGRTMMLVTHDMRMAADVSDHVIFLHEGRIEEEGPPGELFANPRSPRLAQFLLRPAENEPTNETPN